MEQWDKEMVISTGDATIKLSVMGKLSSEQKAIIKALLDTSKFATKENGTQQKTVGPGPYYNAKGEEDFNLDR